MNHKKKTMPSTAYPSFLESDIPPSSYEKALVHIIPVGMEKSVSYGAGTAEGPGAILQASQQLETFDGHSIPGETGIYTHPPVPCNGKTPHEDIALISSTVAPVIRQESVPIILGGEHTVTLGPLRSFKDTGKKIGVIQFDAHADLRDSYEGDHLSHACVMRRIHEMGFPIMQIGIRSLSQPEDIFRKKHNIPCLEAEAIYRKGIPDTVLPPGFPEKIYITFDLDCLDPSIMPATGTPEPGGLNWYQALDLVNRVAEGRTVCGCDVVELAPAPNMHGADFTAAKLVYAMISVINRTRRSAT
jgi:agmatinase